MNILKQGNKIITSQSGEILTQSDALIDLRSTYGFTKNVSNEVSKVKLYNNPSQVFRAPSGNEPTENGDGFEFNDVYETLETKNPRIDYSNVFISCWVKMTSSLLEQRIIQIWNDVIVTNTFEFKLYVVGNTITCKVSLAGTAANVVTATFGITANTWEDTWRYLTIWIEDSLYISILADGVKRVGVLFNGDMSNRGDYPLIIGGWSAGTPRGFLGHVDDITIKYTTKTSIDYSPWDKVFTPPKRSSE